MITLEEYQQIQEYKANGVSIIQTSKCLNITEWNVRSWWNRSEDDLEEYLNKQLYSFDNYRQYIIELIKKGKATLYSRKDCILNYRGVEDLKKMMQASGLLEDGVL